MSNFGGGGLFNSVIIQHDAGLLRFCLHSGLGASLNSLGVCAGYSSLDENLCRELSSNGFRYTGCIIDSNYNVRNEPIVDHGFVRYATPNWILWRLSQQPLSDAEKDFVLFYFLLSSDADANHLQEILILMLEAGARPEAEIVYGGWSKVGMMTYCAHPMSGVTKRSNYPAIIDRALHDFGRNHGRKLCVVRQALTDCVMIDRNRTRPEEYDFEPLINLVLGYVVFTEIFEHNIPERLPHLDFSV